MGNLLDRGTARTPDRAAVPAVIELRAGGDLLHAASPHTKKRAFDCHDISEFLFDAESTGREVSRGRGVAAGEEQAPEEARPAAT
jgi:hypothetical protein